MMKLLRQCRYCNLYSSNRRNPNKRGKGQRYYTIGLRGYPFYNIIEEIRDLVDPLHNIGGRHGSSWSFKSRETAEKLFTMLLLKYGT
jgi:hypothetical protein